MEGIGTGVANLLQQLEDSGILQREVTILGGPVMLEDFVYLGIILHELRLLMVLQEPQQPVRYY